MFKCQNSSILNDSVKQFKWEKTVNSNQGLVLFYLLIGLLSGAITPVQSGPGSDGNEGVPRIPQNSSITGILPSDCLVSYPGYSLGDLTALQRSNWCIPPSQLNGHKDNKVSNTRRTWFYWIKPQVPHLNSFADLLILKYIHMYIYIYIFFFTICVKVCAMPCPHQLPTGGVNTVSVAQDNTATPGTTKQLLPPDRVFKRIIYIYIYIYARSTKSRD